MRHAGVIVGILLVVLFAGCHAQFTERCFNDVREVCQPAFQAGNSMPGCVDGKFFGAVEFDSPPCCESVQAFWTCAEESEAYAKGTCTDTDMAIIAELLDADCTAAGAAAPAGSLGPGVTMVPVQAGPFTDRCFNDARAECQPLYETGIQANNGMCGDAQFSGTKLESEPCCEAVQLFWDCALAAGLYAKNTCSSSDQATISAIMSTDCTSLSSDAEVGSGGGQEATSPAISEAPAAGGNTSGQTTDTPADGNAGGETTDNPAAGGAGGVVEDGSPPSGSSGDAAGDAGAPASSDSVSSSSEEPASEEPSEESNEDDDVCFPGLASVQLQSGATRRMDALRVGDRVLTSKGSYSDVHFFSHKIASGSFQFVKLRTLFGRVLMVTKNHYIVVDGSLQAAGVVVRGSKLTAGDGTVDTVTSVETVIEQGLYAPHTLSGEIAVDGIVASCYTTSVHPVVAHALLAPLRAFYAVLGSQMPALMDDGAPWFAKRMVGPKTLKP